MTEFSIIHVLFVIVAFLLYHLSISGSGCSGCGIRNGFRVGGQSLTLEYIRGQQYDYGIDVCPKDPMQVVGIGSGANDVCTPKGQGADSTLNDCDSCIERLNTYFELCPDDNLKSKYNGRQFGIRHYCPGTFIH